MTRTLGSWLAVCILGASFTPVAATETTISSVAELTLAAKDSSSTLRPFELHATVVTLFDQEKRIPFLVTDGTGYAPLSISDQPSNLTPGDRVHAIGKIILAGDGNVYCHVQHLEITGHGPPPEPINANPEDIYAGRLNYAYLRVTGRVIDAFRDEVDSRFAFLILAVGSDVIHLSSQNFTDEQLAALIDARVAATGICFRYSPSSPRAQLGYEISVYDRDMVTVLEPAPTDPFNVPALTGLAHDIWHHHGGPQRRRLSGRVIAVWNGNRLLLRLMSRKTAFVEIIGKELPRVGDFIDAAGLPETDFYQLNLSNAIWRKREALPISEAPVETIGAATLFTDSSGNNAYQVAYHGRTIRLSGRVHSLSHRDTDEGTMQLDCDGFQLTLDISAIPDALDAIVPGSTIAVVGVCIMETDNWRPQAPFPHVHGLRIVLRDPGDITVIARPTWWTYQRIIALIALLLTALTATIVWNLTLRRLVLRKSRELAKEQLRTEHARLKTAERTRLAIELHDSLSQTLTGIALEMKAAQTATDLADPQARTHLDIAERSLASCHTELRNCLWDLRHSTIGNVNLNEAIRQTIRPQIGTINLSVRCDISRRVLAEETVHTILKMLRELAANAANHGQATRIRIAGVRDGDTLRFAVIDNGRGFDPTTAPGPAQGHFGLLGINDRLIALGGSMTVTSRPGAGTKATLSLPLPKNTAQKERG